MKDEKDNSKKSKSKNLVAAVKSGNLEKVQEWLGKGANANCTTYLYKNGQFDMRPLSPLAYIFSAEEWVSNKEIVYALLNWRGKNGEAVEVTNYIIAKASSLSLVMQEMTKKLLTHVFKNDPKSLNEKISHCHNKMAIFGTNDQKEIAQMIKDSARGEYAELINATQALSSYAKKQNILDNSSNDKRARCIRNILLTEKNPFSVQLGGGQKDILNLIAFNVVENNPHAYYAYKIMQERKEDILTNPKGDREKLDSSCVIKWSDKNLKPNTITNGQSL
jgi:hypothetical protein